MREDLEDVMYIARVRHLRILKTLLHLFVSLPKNKRKASIRSAKSVSSGIKMSPHVTDNSIVAGIGQNWVPRACRVSEAPFFNSLLITATNSCMQQRHSL